MIWILSDEFKETQYLQDALANASCTEIWIAAGVYYPDVGKGKVSNTSACGMLPRALHNSKQLLKKSDYLEFFLSYVGPWGRSSVPVATTYSLL